VGIRERFADQNCVELLQQNKNA